MLKEVVILTGGENFMKYALKGSTKGLSIKTFEGLNTITNIIGIAFLAF